MAIWARVRAHPWKAAAAAAAAGYVLLWLLRAWLTTSILPGILKPQLTAALKREVSFSRVGISLHLAGSSIEVRDFKVARGQTLASGVLAACEVFELRFRLTTLLRYAFHPERMLEAVTKVALTRPSVTLDRSDLLAARPAPRAAPKRPAAPPKDAEAPLAALPPLPKTLVELKGGTFVLQDQGRPVAELDGITGSLDLRDVPHIEGGLRFILAPDSEVSVNGECHLGLRNYKGSMELDRLDLGQLATIARELGIEIPVSVDGRLRANVNVQGGFMTWDELFDTFSGQGSLELANGRVAKRGTALLDDLSTEGTLDDRRISLDRLSARVGPGNLDGAGSLDNLGRGALRLKGHLDHVPVALLRTFSPGLPDTLGGEFSFEFSATGSGRAPFFSGRLTSAGLGVPGVRVENLVAEATYSLNDVTLRNLTARLWDGTFAGSGMATGLRAGGKPRVRFDLKGTGLDVARSPIGKTYAGRANLEVALAGAGTDFQGAAHAEVSQVTALGVPQDDLTASAFFASGKVTFAAWSERGTVSVFGGLPLSGPTVCQSCSAYVDESLPRLLTLAGVKPPEGLRGHVRGEIKVGGSISAPLISAHAKGKDLRLGKIVLGNSIEIPGFIFAGGNLIIPSSDPAVFAWTGGGGGARATLAGRVPVTAFSGTGDQNLALTLNLKGSVDLLKDLDVIQDGDGTVVLAADIGGTAAYPVINRFLLKAAGSRLVIAGSPFAKPFTNWRVSVEQAEGTSEAVIHEFGFTVDKEPVAMAHDQGRFGFTGWKLSSLSLPLDYEGKRGLPIHIEDVADIRVRKVLSVVSLSEDGTRLVIMGPTSAESGERQPAQIEVANGTITFGGSSAREETPVPAARPAAGGVAAASAPAATVFSVADWVRGHLDLVAVFTVGRNVTFAPHTLTEKLTKELEAALKDKKGLMSLVRKYLSAEGLADFLRVSAIEFNVRVKEGTTLKFVKDGDRYAMSGRLHLEPNGKVSLRLPKVAPVPGLGKQDFYIVDEPGKDQYIEFPDFPEDLAFAPPLHATVNVTAETVMYNKTLKDAAGEDASVPELHIRMILTPPPPDEEASFAGQFLWFKQRFATDPETVTGEVTVAAGGSDAATTAGTAAPGTGAVAAGGVAQTRPVTIQPDQGTLLAALIGIDELTNSLQSGPGNGNMMSALIGILKPIGVGYVLDYALLRPLKFGLDLVGLDPDELAIKKSDTMQSHTSAAQAVAAAGGTSALSGSLSNFSDALNNTELSIGKTFAKNLYLNYSAVLLDSSAITGGVSSQAAVAGTTQTSNAYVQMVEAEWKAGRAKIKAKARYPGLPDDPNKTEQYELYVGTEVGESFNGLGQREKFAW